jgi:L-lactate dehydrogenase complex protein LldE
MPRVGLFIPCYVDQLYPQVAMATLELLERYGCEVDFPAAQTCCGQPMANTGCVTEAKPLAEKFLAIFKDYDYVVCPSGSCTAMVTHHYEELLHGQPSFEELRKKTFELCEFLVDVLKVGKVEGRFPYKVGLHNKAGQLLSGLEGIELVPLKRPDECCGFGGTFAVAEEAVSCMMGLDRIHDHEQAGADVMTAGDM